ncbi:MAG: hypothetical protein V4722_03900 [Bacteroidota bacterium]
MKKQFILLVSILLHLLVLSAAVSGQKYKQILHASNADGRLEVYLLDNAGEVFHKYQKKPNNGWSDWYSLGGKFIQSIFAENNSDGSLVLFALGGDGAITHKKQVAPNGGWGDWASLGGSNLKQLFAMKNADGRLELFVLGGDNAVWHKWQSAPNGGWGEWASLGGTNLKQIFVSKNADGRLELAALGADQRIWHKWQQTPNGGWGEWASLGGTGLKKFYVSTNADKRLELFAIGGDNGIWHTWQVAPNGGWSQWASLGGNGLKKLFVSSNADGRLELFALGGDNAIWHKWQQTPSGGWGEWASLGGRQILDFVVGKNADGRMEIFSLATDDAEWKKWQLLPNGGWSDWSYSLVNAAALNNYPELAFHYAPIHYQDTDNSNPKADYITSVNYDNNWNTIDNWDNINNAPLAATVYYSIVETCTHWYILYAFYHPRDWDEYATSEHENDLEGIIQMIRKDGTPYGKMEGAITIAHWDLYSFTPRSSPLSNGGEGIDGTLRASEFEGSAHPLTSQEAKGHGLKAYPHIGDFSGKEGEDGIIYYPSRTTAQVPTSGNDRRVLYKLVDIFAPGGLWAHQLSDIGVPRENASVFVGFGSFKGDGTGGCGDGGGGTAWCSIDGADAPWKWDGKDTDSHRGDFALDPANLFQKFYSGLGNFDTRYLNNQYLSDLKNKGYSSGKKPPGWNDAVDMNALFSRIINQCQ